MRILHVISTIERGGAEKQLLVLLAEQINNNNVSVVYRKGKPELNEELRNLGIKIQGPVLKRLGSKAHFVSLQTVAKIMWSNFRNKPSVIHSHLPHAEIFASLLKLPGQVLVSTRHNSELFFPSGPRILSIFLSRLTTIRTNQIIAISKDVDRFLKSSKEIRRKLSVSVVYYGFNQHSTASGNSKTEAMRGKIGIHPSDFVFGTISRLVSQKDIPTLLRGFAKASEFRKGLKLLIVGDGNKREELIRYGLDLGLKEEIIWFGRTDNVENLLDLMDAFILSSKYEGFGLVLLEAMNAQLPVLASNISAIPEVLGQDYDLLFKCGDYEDLAKKMEMLLTMPSQKLDFLVEYLQERLKFFDSYKMANEVQKIYLRGNRG